MRHWNRRTLVFALFIGGLMLLMNPCWGIKGYTCVGCEHQTGWDCSKSSGFECSLSGQASCGHAANCSSQQQQCAQSSQRAAKVFLGYLRSATPPDLRIPVGEGARFRTGGK